MICTSKEFSRTGRLAARGKFPFHCFGGNTFTVVHNQNNSAQNFTFGQADDVPLIADFDGDGKTDIPIPAAYLQ